MYHIARAAGLAGHDGNSDRISIAHRFHFDLLYRVKPCLGEESERRQYAACRPVGDPGGILALEILTDRIDKKGYGYVRSYDPTDNTAWRIGDGGGKAQKWLFRPLRS